MKYKILIASKTNGDVNYFRYYKVSPSDGDWSTTDKQTAIDKITELLEIYSLSEISVVISLDITTTIDIPSLPEEQV